MNDIKDKLKQLKEYHKNPRYIARDDLNNLEKWLYQFGDLSGIVINVNTWEIISGNQRNKVLDLSKAVFKDWDILDAPTPTGTVAWARAEFNGELFTVRFVMWDEETTEQAVIIANKAGGYWNMDKLINEFDSEVLLKTGWTEEELMGLFDKGEDLLNDDSDITKEEIPVFSVVVYFESEETMLSGLVAIEQALDDAEIEGTTQIVRK